MRRLLLLGLAAVAWPLAAQDAIAIDEFVARLKSSSDVAWLETLAASSEGLLTEWRRTVHRAAPNKTYRADAYARLGAIGTAESLAAIARIEQQLSGQRLIADAVDAGALWTGPIAGHPDRPLQPTASTIIGQRSYAAVLLETYGPFAVYVLWQDHDDGRRWSRPYLAGQPSPLSWSFDPALAPRAGGFVARFIARPSIPATAAPPPPVAINLKTLTLDSDGDGWTDLEERQLGLDPKRADTDGDGLRDDVDVSPRYAPAAGADLDDEAKILRRALFAHYGLTESRWALFAREGSRPLQLDGHAGPVLFGFDLPTREPVRTPPAIRGGAQGAWTVSRKSADEAVVEFTDWAGASFRSQTRVTVRRIAGEWVVTAAAR